MKLTGTKIPGFKLTKNGLERIPRDASAKAKLRGSKRVRYVRRGGK